MQDKYQTSQATPVAEQTFIRTGPAPTDWEEDHAPNENGGLDDYEVKKPSA